MERESHPETAVGWHAADLAPGDGKSAGLDRRALRVRSVRGVDGEAFGEAYRLLWEQFGPGGGMETEEVITARLAWPPREREDGWTLYYELLTVTDQDGWTAVRDHSIIIPPSESNGAPPFVAVHLSHLLVAPRWRRTGLAGWMRALPLQAARRCLQSHPGRGQAVPVTLITEMDPLLPGQPERAGRMLAYGRAGFRVVDPAAVEYLQPDFRPPSVIAAGGGAVPVAMVLLVRRVGREGEGTMDGTELRALVRTLYRMYAGGCRPEDIEPLREHIDVSFPAPGTPVHLRAPHAFISE